MLVPLLLDNQDIGGLGPVVLGAIPTLNTTVGLPITPLDVSQYFAGATSYDVDPDTLPPGIEFDGSTFTGIPSTLGTFELQVVGTNDDGSVISPPFAWVISPVRIPIPPALIQENSFVQRQTGVARPLADLHHVWGNDIVLSQSQDIQTAELQERGKQHILRRLMTNPGDYIWHPEYGAGLPSWLGQPLDAAKIAALVKSQMLLEDSVAKSPPPVVTVTATSAQEAAGEFSISATYTDQPSKAPTVLSFAVTN